MEKNTNLKSIILDTLDSNKALDIVSIDLKNKSSMADCMIIASGTSSRHIQALSEILIDELGGSGGEPDGADILNYIYSDYTAQWSLSAPGGVETISLSGLAFIGYYIGGDHQYVIVKRSANEMTLKSLDGNGEFDWGFVLTAE